MQTSSQWFFGALAALLMIFAGSAQAASADANANYVNRVYQDLLQTQPDSTTLNQWDNYLGGGGSRYNFVLSLEGTNQYLDLLIRQEFNRLLHRPPSSSEVNTFQSFLGSGTIEQMQSAILGSAEYFADAGGTNTGFIDAMYSAVLGRTPSPGELSGWNGILTSGAQRSDVALVNLSGDEYRQDFVGGAYNQFLHRAANSTELNFYVGAMRSGATDQQIVADLLSTDEYYNLAQVPEPTGVAAIGSALSILILRRRRA